MSRAAWAFLGELGSSNVLPSTRRISWAWSLRDEIVVQQGVEQIHAPALRTAQRGNDLLQPFKAHSIAGHGQISGSFLRVGKHQQSSGEEELDRMTKSMYLI